MGKQATKPAATASAATAALLALLLGVLTVPPQVSAQGFACSGTPKPNCTSLLGYPVANYTITNYTTIAALFGIQLPLLLAANNASASKASKPVGKPTVTVPIPCTCSSGKGNSGNTTAYVVKKGDGLDHIARDIFGLLVIYQDVAKFNNIPNPDLIEVGQKIYIPLPCSCDQDVAGEEVVHYAYKVADGDTVDGIGKKTGTAAATILAVNGIDSKGLKAEMVIDVPLRACGDSPSPIIAGTNLTMPGPCSSGAASPGGSPSTSGGSSPAGNPAARALPRSGWTTLLLVMSLVLAITRLG